MADANVLRVLVADDEEGMRRGILRVLAGLTVTVPDLSGEFRLELEEAADGDAALARLETGEIDILFLDHSMPGHSGMEILDWMREQDAETLTVMVTAYASLDMAVRATKQGAFDFLAKPFTPSELRDAALKVARHLVTTREARRLARERQQMRFQFLSVLAHELKAPLGAVEGFLQLLADGSVEDRPEQRQHMIDRCLLRVEGMRKLIFDLLDLTRIESGQKQRELCPLDLAAVAEHVLETFRPEAERRGISMTLELAADTQLLGDPSEVEIILNNLISNAVKYNRDGGSVTLRIEGDEDRLHLAVTDTGIGMSEADQARLFNEFVRIRNDRTRDILGSGLGLSILRRLTRLAGGDVSVESVEGEGTTFRVSLSRSGESRGPDREPDVLLEA